MDIYQSQLDKLIYSLEESKSYLNKKANLEFGYQDLIRKIDSQIDFTNTTQPVIKLVSTASDLVLKLKEKSEADAKLKSLYHFEAIAPFKNILEIVTNCTAIVAIFKSDRTITKHQCKLIDLAKTKNVSLFILVVNQKSTNTKAFTEYWRSHEQINNKTFILPTNSFFNLNNARDFESYQQFLIERKIKLQNKFVRDNCQNAIVEIDSFFDRQSAIARRKIKQIKQDYLQDKEVNYYRQQILNKTFNQIKQQKQKKVYLLKQQVNRSRNEYLNPFKLNSWLFELQEIIERSQVKIVLEKSDTYLYATVENGARTEYIHNYILNLYQQRVIDILEFQWSKINYIYGDGGLKELIAQINREISNINLLNYSAAERPQVTFNIEPLPKLDLAEIIDPGCLQLNSRLVFDYNYTQSTWFKLLISVAIGTSIYLITKLYFGTGKYLGFFILFFQTINIFTGQSVKQTKLKSHEKELRRILNNKYQIFARLVVEQMSKTLITDLEQKSEQCQTQIDAIAELALKQIDAIERDLQGYQLKIKQLKQDRIKITNWFS